MNRRRSIHPDAFVLPLLPDNSIASAVAVEQIAQTPEQRPFALALTAGPRSCGDDTGRFEEYCLQAAGSPFKVL